ncbi:MAG TPA: hypothetical protein PKM88_02025 [bacterium]|nr:hypothetical protein [bacterium]
MDQDAQQLRLLAVFHYVVAGLAFVFGCVPVFHILIGADLLFDLQLTGFSQGAHRPPPLFGAMFFGMGLLTLLLAWSLAGMTVAAGWHLGRHRAHLFCLVTAAVLCIFVPFGTVLGIFTIIVLSRPSVQMRFGQLPATACNTGGESAPA